MEPGRQVGKSRLASGPEAQGDSLGKEKNAYVAQGIDESRFHRCPPGRSEPEERRFMYFDPDVGEPTIRT